MLPLSLLGLALHLVCLSLGFPGELLGLTLALAQDLVGITLHFLGLCLGLCTGGADGLLDLLGSLSCIAISY